MPALKYRAGDFFNKIIPYENDLSNLRIENPDYYQTAWHGSPNDFDSFSLDHMGEGEGAQVHGWGLYFADNRKVSEGYQHMRDDGDSLISYCFTFTMTPRSVIRYTFALALCPILS